ncbi:MAG: MFS transporter [Chloroflexi bacterium]|nr:MFS transporter [Chloroflexota bacterium]
MKTQSLIKKPIWRVQDYFDLGVIGTTHGLSDSFSGLLKPILVLMVLDLGLTTFQAGTLLSIFSVTTFLFLYPFSLLADFGGRKKEILILGLAVATVAFFAMQWAPNLAAVSLCVFLAGAGNATFHPCGTALTTERFSHNRSYAVSFYSMMGNAGASLMPVALSMIAVAAGWRSAISICVLPALILLPLVGFRFQNVLVSTASDNTEEPLIDRMWQQMRSLSRTVFQNRDVVLLATIYALSGMGTGVVTGFLSLLAFDRFALSTTAIGGTLSLYYLAGVFAKPLMGYLYNRWGAQTALLIPLLLAGILTLGVALTPWQFSFVPIIALLGATIPISPIILTAAADRSDQAAMASSVGFIYTCHGLGFISPLIGGWLAELYRLEWCYVYAAILLWIGAGVTLLLPKKKGNTQ